ncbi:YdjY domain-containing protein [Tautonia plasticadhaerens]|uniref:Uncharacterized protein n=1 Tax=Tautonia plasticadhaerens TaxID=2527974 RepID=A0A518GZW2_9BACT|nr:YdjY domain-containing protein [Tautonia plasticadhaerens]QDV34127.1 hypothetical protein ElP_20100 [Tautonia plasticadhaerens]
MLAPWLACLAVSLGTAPQLPIDAPREDHFEAPEGYRPLGPALWFDPEARRLVMRAQVVKRDGFLEHLLCLRNTKEHEAILATDASPRLIHAGLILTGVEPGHPVRYQPEFTPPEGPAIAITVEWAEGGEARKADARSWVQEEETGTPLEIRWVFAGSFEIDRPGLERPLYAADGGDLITVSNFPEAILDLPIASTADDAALNYVANTPAIAPLGEFVTLYFEPVTQPDAPADQPG